MQRHKYKTLGDLMRDITIEGECWLWQGATSVTGTPWACVNGLRQQVRRAVWEMVKGEYLADNERLSATCRAQSCVAPHHVRIRRTLTDADWLELMKAADAGVKHRELAAQVGICRENVSRGIAKMRRELAIAR